MMRESIVFYKSFYDGIRYLPPEEQLKAFYAIFDYAFEGTLPQGESPALCAFYMAKPLMDANYKRYESGQKGGRPKKEKAEVSLGESEEKPLVLEPEGLEKPNENENGTENELDENGKERKKEQEDEADEEGSGTSADHPRYPYREIIDYLNQATGASFRCQSRDTRSLIRQRIDEGYTLKDFQRVIDRKAGEWGKAPAAGEKDMRPYLRPSTLFGKRFESYLNQPAPLPEAARRRESYDIDAFERKLGEIPVL